MEEVNDLCQEPFLDEEDREELQQKLNDLRTNWGEVRTEALQKETKWVTKNSAHALSSWFSLSIWLWMHACLFSLKSLANMTS